MAHSGGGSCWVVRVPVCFTVIRCKQSFVLLYVALPVYSAGSLPLSLLTATIRYTA